MSGLTRVLVDLLAAFGFAAGYLLRWTQEISRRHRRLGGYVRCVPMASVHPREPKP